MPKHYTEEYNIIFKLQKIKRKFPKEARERKKMPNLLRKKEKNYVLLPLRIMLYSLQVRRESSEYLQCWEQKKKLQILYLVNYTSKVKEKYFLRQMKIEDLKKFYFCQDICFAKHAFKMFLRRKMIQVRNWDLCKERKHIKEERTEGKIKIYFSYS